MERQIVIAALAALAQETRLDIFRSLVQAGDEGIPAGMIGARLTVPNATLSFHLQQLKYAELVTTLRKGTTIIYKANYGTMNDLIAYLTENCCAGSASQDCIPEPACRPGAINQPSMVKSDEPKNL